MQKIALRLVQFIVLVELGMITTFRITNTGARNVREMSYRKRGSINTWGKQTDQHMCESCEKKFGENYMLNLRRKACHGPLTRYAKLRVAHAPGTFFPRQTSKETTIQRSRHASRHVDRAPALMHVGIANPRW